MGHTAKDSPKDTSKDTTERFILTVACADRPGIRGCHSQLDQGALYPKHARRLLEPAWAEDTRRKIFMMGLWPKTLPTWQEGGRDAI